MKLITHLVLGYGGAYVFWKYFEMVDRKQEVIRHTKESEKNE